MARGDQLKALLLSYVEGDEAQFYSIAMQLAADEARKGHGRLAEELRELIDRSKVARKRSAVDAPIPINRPRGELAQLLRVDYPKTRLADLIVSTRVEQSLKRIVKEQRHLGKLLEHGLSPRRKILLVGAPGTRQNPYGFRFGGRAEYPAFRSTLRCAPHEVHGRIRREAAPDL